MSTPMMKQYRDIKDKYQDCIVFFRLGDFYEMFFEDAKLCSRELEITLTSRGTESKIPMAGVPHHAADQYIARLVSRGYKVVICEQVEDPKQAKGIVKREVTKIITPGTITDVKSLEEKKNNYLGCIVKKRNNFGIAFVDLMTGEFLTTEIQPDFPFQDLINEIGRFSPKECVVNNALKEDILLCTKLKEQLEVYFTVKDDSFFDGESNKDLLISQFHQDKLKDVKRKPHAFLASGACLKYLTETQKMNLTHLNSIKYYENTDFMMLDISCRKNLELTESLRDNKKTGSLLWVMDNTVTAMGARLLRKWIEQPLIDIIKIKERQDAVEELFNDFFFRDELRQLLKNTYDIERLTGKLVCGNANARDLLAIKNTIKRFPDIKLVMAKGRSKLMRTIDNLIDSLEDLFKLLDSAISEEPPISIKEAGIIKEGFDEQIDKLRRASREGKTWIANLEQKERDNTGIKSLKIGFNKVFGYYIEVTKANLRAVPDSYIRKQTLVNSERYITEELKEYEALILNAEDRLASIEYDVFCNIRDQLISQIPRLKESAYGISLLDSILSLAEVSYKNNYIRPEMTLKDEINITDGRHPVVEVAQKHELFIPNDTLINSRDNMISIITGPNMAGKSTYMRQVALIVLMAQIGCFIPAKKAEIGIVDRIFTRIGASDNLASGQSTFMVEMTEVAHILKNATAKSLLILDEVGRGTSTFDGLSIAWAVIEYIQKHLKSKTLFATHYHELTVLRDLKGIKNYKITVKERGEDVVFLRKIVPGEADKSYGIQVAKLAGIPKSVISRAQTILNDLENEPSAKKKNINNNVAAASDDDELINQLGLHDLKEEEILCEIRELDVNTISPLEALSFLFSIKQKLI